VTGLSWIRGAECTTCGATAGVKEKVTFPVSKKPKKKRLRIRVI